ncbi:MAG TPA: hypothetical protein VEW46_25590 [Pyrinomonadaceae bacterium]|nr:hypothetical protein [Pyrinomonadaceae bacterium]
MRLSFNSPEQAGLPEGRATAKKACGNGFMEIKLLVSLDLREQAALQAALVTHGAPDALVTLALTGACRISSVDEARQLRKWLAEARTAGETDFASLHVIERGLVEFGV